MIPNNRASEHNFALVPKQRLPRSSFGRTKKDMFTAYFDKLYPMYTRLYNPGDTTNFSMQTFARLPASVVPLMDNMMWDMQAFEIPLRILSKNFRRLYANEQEYPSQDNSTLQTPRMDFSSLPDSGPLAGKFDNGTIYDMFHWPTRVNLRTGNAGGESDIHLAAWKPLAYNMVWNYYYRDENLQDPVYFDDDQDLYDFDDFELLTRNMRPDYFQTLLKTPQKGFAPLVPLDGSAIVKLLEVSTQPNLLLEAATRDQSYPGGVTSIAFPSGGETSLADVENNLAIVIDPNNQWYADLSDQMAGFTINDFRLSYSVQLLLEADGRQGTRFAESLYHRWGVVIPDAFLSQPSYIAYATTDFNTHIVPQTSSTSNSPGTAFANLSAYTTQRGYLKFSHSFKEPALLMILGSGRGNVTYQQGLPREDTIKTRYDFYHPEFAHLGEMAVLKQELFVTGTATDQEVLGYQEYGGDYRYSPSTVRGQFRSNDPLTLDAYHLATEYDAQPSLNAAYSVSVTPIARNVPYANSAPPILCDMWISETVTTSMPMYSVPGLGRTI